MIDLAGGELLREVTARGRDERKKSHGSGATMLPSTDRCARANAFERVRCPCVLIMELFLGYSIGAMMMMMFE